MRKIFVDLGHDAAQELRRRSLASGDSEQELASAVLTTALVGLPKVPKIGSWLLSTAGGVVHGVAGRSRA